jgi:hypothetical protein
VLLKQQPPAQVLPAQQGEPVEPQIWQIPEEDEDDEQMVPAVQRSVPFVPAQHCSPAPPQEAQTPLRQVKPEPQVDPQHGCPEAPQPEHWPALHMPGPPPALPPEPLVELPQAVPSATHVPL